MACSPRIGKSFCRIISIVSAFASPLAVSSAWGALGSLSTGASLQAPDFGAFERLQPLTQANLYSQWTPDSAIKEALSDSLGRVDASFNIPEELQEKVRFWAAIFGRYSQYQTVIYDTAHPEIIYEVLDFSDLKKRSRNLVAYEIVRQRILSNTMRDYETAFRKLAARGGLKLRSEHGLTGKEIQIYRALVEARPETTKGSTHNHTIQAFHKGFRAQTGLRDQLIHGLVRSQRLLPSMRTIFDEEQVPHELIQISLVESSFNHGAISRSGATGVWQIMPTTGKRYLRMDETSGIDERLSPLKSTRAAARILRDNFKFLDSWALAVTAYNSGYRGLLKIPRQRRLGDALYKELRPCGGTQHLGIAGRNYFAEFLAVMYLVEYRDVVFSMTVDSGQPTPFQTHRTRRSQRLAELLKREKLDKTTFLEWNPDLARAKMIPKNTEFFFPVTPESVAANDRDNVGLHRQAAAPANFPPAI